MLKSTHRPVQEEKAPLPAGWTEHKAPSGHTYYYNVTAKQSTYSRPVEQPLIPQFQPIYQPSANAYSYNGGRDVPRPRGSGGPLAGGDHTGFATGANREQPRFNHPGDRPKTQHKVPGCAPWVLVKTRLGRRFVHNPSTGKSFWKFPQEVIGGVVEFDIQERKRLEGPQEDAKLAAGDEGHQIDTAPGPPPIVAARSTPAGSDQKGEEGPNDGDDSDEYEEVEVTDDDDGDDERAAKRRKTSQEPDRGDSATPPPAELGEDDMAFQLAQMGEPYDLDADEYGDGDDAAWATDGDHQPMANEEAAASFRELLDDSNVNPFTTWEQVLDAGQITDDARYTLLPTTKSRKEVFAAWSAARIDAHRAQKAQHAPPDPRAAFLSLLHTHATPRLFWPEFKRKFKKDPAMRDAALPDKAREALYRDLAARLGKTTEATRRAELRALLAALPPSRSAWHRDTRVPGGPLPAALTVDVRWAALPGAVREDVVRAYIETLPRAGEIEDGGDGAAGAAGRGGGADGAAEALRRREAQIDAERRRQQRDLRAASDLMRGEEAQLDRAMRVGKDGLMKNLEAR